VPKRLLAYPLSLLENFLYELGVLWDLFFQTLTFLPRPPFYPKQFVKQFEIIGVNSLMVVGITTLFTGAVLSLQSYNAFKRFNAESLIGAVVAVAMCRELSPVLTGLIVAGRAGSAMAAEIGTMRVTEQIDALYTLATNPIKYLIIPRFLASIVVLPLLSGIGNFVGIFGGWFVAVKLLGVNDTTYQLSTWNTLILDDVTSGLIKSSVFGGIIAIIGCYKGFYTHGGAEGVGKSTTGSVVVSSMAILISDYFLTAALF